MEYHSILYEEQGAVASITLNRPEKLNALTDEAWSELAAALTRAAGREEICAVLLKGNGKAFCSGFDVERSSNATRTKKPWEQLQAIWGTYRNQTNVFNFPKPIVCAVQGYCLGGGFDLAKSCDFIVASDDAVFGETELRLCFVPGMLDVYMVGMRKAKEILMLAEKFGAEKALELGFVNWVVPREELEEKARQIAEKLAKLPTEPMQMTKRLIHQAFELQGAGAVNSWAYDSLMLSKLIVPELRQKFNAISEEQGGKAALRWLNEYYESGNLKLRPGEADCPDEKTSSPE